MLLVPMTALADVIEPTVDYVHDKVIITGEFEAADGAEDKIATLVVVNPDKNLADFATDSSVINWADQCVVKNGKFTFEIDTFEIADNEGYTFYISAPGVEKTFEGTFNYSEEDMEDALIEKLNDSGLKAAGIDEFIRVHAKDRITEIKPGLVAKYEGLKNPMNVATSMIGKRPFISLNDFATKLETLINGQSKPSGSGSGSGGGVGGGGGSFSGGASAEIIAPAEVNPFNDVANTYWGKAAILDLYNKGIVKGQGNGYFRPENTITRAEFVQMVVMAFGFGMNGEKANFADVADSDWFANAVQIAYSNGVVNGTSDTTFSPTSNITRQDMMTILYNAAKAKGINLTSGSTEFTDASDISGYAQDAVAAMVGSNVVSGYIDGSVKPLNNASRAEAAAMLSRLLAVK